MSRPECELVHSGVKGMKWGVRKRPRSTVTPSSDHVQSREHKSKPVKALSNKELKALNNRLQMEKTLSELKSSNKIVNKGHNKVKAILALGATAQAAYTFSKTPVGKAIGVAVRTAMLPKSSGGKHKL